jgi:hypothetical protein
VEELPEGEREIGSLVFSSSPTAATGRYLVGSTNCQVESSNKWKPIDTMGTSILIELARLQPTSTSDRSWSLPGKRLSRPCVLLDGEAGQSDYGD